MAGKVRTEQESSTSIPQAKLKLVPISQITPAVIRSGAGGDIRSYGDAVCAEPDGLSSAWSLRRWWSSNRASARVSRSGTRSRAVVRRPRNQDRPIRGHALTFEAQQRVGKQCSGTNYGLRLDLARALALTGPIEWVEEEEDGPHRKLADPAPLGDVVLARKDVPTSYHLAVTVDDAIQGVTLVTRGEDLATATHIHRVLQALLGLPTPRYRHHELVTDAAGRRLSKRDQPLTIRSMRESGMSPAEIIARAASTGRGATASAARICDSLSRAGGEVRLRRRGIPDRPAAEAHAARRNRGSPD